MESAGVGVRLDRACVDGSLGEQVVICVCTVLAYGAYRASEVSSVGAALRAKSRLIAPYRLSEKSRLPYLRLWSSVRQCACGHIFMLNKHHKA